MPIVAIPQLFAVLAQNNFAQIGEVIRANYPADHFPLTQDQWLLVATGTAKEICDQLGITDGRTGTAVVIVGTGSYYGRATPQVWEWLKSKLGTPHA